MSRKMYHTQERRTKKLIAPVKCIKDNAWLGEAWYFWYDDVDARHWGEKSKRAKGYYEIYSADLDCENTLDTVFDENQYLTWMNAIKRVEKRLLDRGVNPTIKLLNDFFYEHGVWAKFTGILFQDISNYKEDYLTTGFQYKKRIQLAVYNQAIISNFKLHSDGKCE